MADYPAIEEFNRRYNGLIKLPDDSAYNRFVEQTVATLIQYKKDGGDGRTGNVVLQEGLP